MKVASRLQAKGSHDLPAAYSREIGRAMVKFAYLEEYMRRVPIALLGLTLPQGSIAVRNPRMADLMAMITDLEALGTSRLPKELVAILSKTLPDLERRRDRIAHGKWAKADDQWLILETKGNWNAQGIDGAPKGKRLITPEFVPVSVSDLKLLVSDMDKAIQDARTLGDALGRNSNPEDIA